MIEIIVCTVLMGLPNENEVCYIAESSITEETYCATAEAMAVIRRHPLRVSYCRPVLEFGHPADVVAKLSDVTLVGDRSRPLPKRGDL